MQKTLSRVIAIAPMLEWTDRHCRYFLRLISKQVLLYTEMITCKALLHNDAQRWLSYHPAEHPLALQLGGSNPQELAQCARLAEQYHYDEVNLNLGCPSDRVQNAQFGACLMTKPKLVAECVAAMQDAVTIPVSIKTRIGVDQHDTYTFLADFINELALAGCQIFIIHARKAWLQGLSPKQNREIPPLEYDKVYQLKKDFPHLHIGINGGITSLVQIEQHLQQVDSVMVGRKAYHDPYWLVELDNHFYHTNTEIPSRLEVLEAFLPYIESQLKQGVRLQQMTRHILGLFKGIPGANRWRRYISEHAHFNNAGIEVIRQAIRAMQACQE
jgi:tRNA-dihydrouridine synthase A